MKTEDTANDIYQQELTAARAVFKNIGRSVVIFGSASIKEDTPYYDMAVETGKVLAQSGFAVITGGGKGLMEAVNKGAQQANGISAAICMKFPNIFVQNDYIDDNYNIVLTNMAARKQIFWEVADAFVALPGGFGTLDEITECLTMMQMNNIKLRPLVFQDRNFWLPVITWTKGILKNTYKVITDNDLNFLSLSHDPKKTVSLINTLINRK